MRLKGRIGSFRPLDRKSGFKLNFDFGLNGGRFLGIEKLAVNNMVQDPSMQREVLGYRLFREGGAPAPRAGHAVVTVNGPWSVRAFDLALLLSSGATTSTSARSLSASYKATMPGAWYPSSLEMRIFMVRGRGTRF